MALWRFGLRRKANGYRGGGAPDAVCARSGGAKILTAMVLGIEIQGRLRAAAGALESHELRFHPPGFVGPIGAAVAAGHLLDFDAAQFANAIGIAGSRCGGLFINLGTMTKATHCAYAAALGLEAAPLGCS